MGLTRKKVTVRTKKGKTFQRSVMVRSLQPKTRRGLKIAGAVAGLATVTGLAWAYKLRRDFKSSTGQAHHAQQTAYGQAAARSSWEVGQDRARYRRMNEQIKTRSSDASERLGRNRSASFTNQSFRMVDFYTGRQKYVPFRRFQLGSGRS